MTLASRPMPSPDDSAPRRPLSELAAILTSAAPEEEKERAVAALRPAIERVAAEVASGRPGDLAQRIRQDAWGVIWEKLTRTAGATYDPSRGDFEAWCRVVLGNWAKDLFKHRARDPVDLARPGVHGRAIPPEVERLPDRSPGKEAAEESCRRLEESLEEVRSWLNEVGGDWAERGVDFFAVFLLHLRQGLVNRLGRTWAAETDDLPGGEISSVAERCIPWHPPEKLRSFRPGWPALSAVWDALRPVADAPPYRLEGDAVCDAINRLRGGSEVTVACWHQWTNRARRRARERIAPDAWQRLFAPWLPTPRPAGRPPECEP
jgi:hypothetical protein